MMNIIKSAFVGIGLLALPFSVFAQHILKCTVTDSATGEKLPEVGVSINTTLLSTFTDLDGKFKVNLNDGTYKISFKYVGYSNKTVEITLPKDSVINVKLSASAVNSDEVVVSATRAGDKTPTTYNNIDKDYLAKSNVGQDMPFLLNFTPSMVVQSDAGAGVGYTYIHIRGSDASRVNVTIDGVPINDAEDQGVYWVDMPDIVSSTDNIQIQRGVGTSTNGAGAFGASINMETTKLTTLPYAEYSTSAGSYNTFKNTFQFGSGLIDGHWEFDGRASKITSDGYVDRATSDFESAFMDAGYYSKNTMIKMIVFTGKEKTYQAWYGDPQDSVATNPRFNPAGEYFSPSGQLQGFYPNETDNYEQDYYQLHIAQHINSNFDLNAAVFLTNGYGYYEDFDNLYTYSDYGLQSPGIGKDTGNFMEDLWLNNKFYGSTVTLKYTDHSRLNASLGGAWDEYDGLHYENLIWSQYGGVPSPNYQYEADTAKKIDYNIFANATYQLTKKLSLYGDMQYRHIDYKFLGINEFFQNVDQDVVLNFFNPKGGLSYDISATQNAYASVAVGNHEPSRDDYTQSTPASRPLPEHLVDWEAGYKQQWKKFAFQGNLYYMDYKNQLVLNGQVNDVGAYNRINVPESYREGIELQWVYQPIKWLRWDANATYSINKIVNFNEYVDSYDSVGNSTNVLYKVHPLSDISFSPSWIGGSILTFIPVKRLELAILTKYVSEQYLDNTQSEARSIPGYCTFDFRINYAVPLKKWMKEMDFTLLVNNLTSLKYVSNGYTNEYMQNDIIYSQNNVFPQAPINFLAGVNFKF